MAKVFGERNGGAITAQSLVLVLGGATANGVACGSLCCTEICVNSAVWVERRYSWS